MGTQLDKMRKTLVRAAEEKQALLEQLRGGGEEGGGSSKEVEELQAKLKKVMGDAKKIFDKFKAQEGEVKKKEEEWQAKLAEAQAAGGGGGEGAAAKERERVEVLEMAVATSKMEVTPLHPSTLFPRPCILHPLAPTPMGKWQLFRVVCRVSSWDALV